MTRSNIITALAGIALAFTISCGSKEKKSEEKVDMGGEPTAELATKDISFDPEGSDSGNIAGLKTVNFDYDKATLTTSARRILSENANWIREHGKVTVQVEGHCDQRGSIEYNLALGERRAKSVKNYLVSLGVDPKAMTIISYGKEKPISTGDTDADFAKNRRANFVPLPQ